MPTDSRSSILAGLAAVALLSQTACGGDDRSPAAPAAPPTNGLVAGTTLAVVSGETGAPVAGARLILGGRELISDASGHVALPERVDFNTPFDVLAAGFVDRQTLLRAPGTAPLALWPKSSATGLDEHFSATLVYTSTGDAAATGAAPLLRHAETTTQVFLAPSPEVLADADALARLELGAAQVTTALGGRVVYTVAPDAPASAVRFSVTFNAADAGCTGARAFARWRTRGSEIVGGEIVFCVIDALYTSTVTHELGHTAGLHHSPGELDVMAPFFSRRRSQDFTPREALALRLMLTRRAGNRWPDNDRDTRTSGATLRSWIVVCH